jgi:hypothetical protein
MERNDLLTLLAQGRRPKSRDVPICWVSLPPISARNNAVDKILSKWL